MCRKKQNEVISECSTQLMGVIEREEVEEKY